jgi:hypothetical protein
LLSRKFLCPTDSNSSKPLEIHTCFEKLSPANAWVRGPPSCPAVPSLEEVVNAMPDKSLISSIRENLAFIILDLPLSEDSQAWMIENGFLKLLASILRTAKQDQKDRTATISCCVVLTRLCDSRTCLSKLKEADVLSIVRPYSTLLKSKIPGVWDAFLGKLTVEESFEQFPGAMWKYYGKANMFSIPTVCSWEGCLEKAVADFEKGARFSKCGRCAVALYCRYLTNPFCPTVLDLCDSA